MANKLRLEPRLKDGDGFYEKLINLHHGLEAQQSAIVNAKLILLLANHVGDEAILDEALAIAAAEKSQT